MLSGREKLRIHRHAISDRETVVFVRKTDDGEHFCPSLLAHPFGARRRGVGRDAIAAIVGNADRDIDQFLGQRIQGP